MSANLDELGARMADHALAAEVEEMREKLGVLSTLADKDALEEPPNRCALRRARRRSRRCSGMS